MGQKTPDQVPEGRLANFEFTFELASEGLKPDQLPLDVLSDMDDSVMDYPQQFGRTYHAFNAGSYAFPNDEQELEREIEVFNMIHKVMGNKLHFAPFSRTRPPKNVLDIATGTGTWAIAMGDEYPSAVVCGVDLSPVQPSLVPPNTHFVVADANETWNFSEPFDFIHTRMTNCCWSDYSTQIIRQAYDQLAPGGYLESQEVESRYECDDGTLDRSSALLRWAADLNRAADLCGRQLGVTGDLRRWYEEAGFVDVHERVFRWPINGWPRDQALREIGCAWERSVRTGMSGYTLQLYHRAFGLSLEQMEVALVGVRRELSDTKIHAYQTFRVVWGRKPYLNEAR